ncbi:hypothetical protein BJ742DRAFT_745858 [Cladochytrium replicatum]|nr:hypothetical protein BJ742DRAFT_745858 [Cladochytrium replicatum]
MANKNALDGPSMANKFEVDGPSAFNKFALDGIVGFGITVRYSWFGTIVQNQRQFQTLSPLPAITSTANIMQCVRKVMMATIIKFIAWKKPIKRFELKFTYEIRTANRSFKTCRKPLHPKPFQLENTWYITGKTFNRSELQTETNSKPNNDKDKPKDVLNENVEINND